MGSGLSTSSRAEITAKFPKAYVKAPKADKGQIPDQLVGVAGWSRDNSRRWLGAAARPPRSDWQVAKQRRRQRNPKFLLRSLIKIRKAIDEAEASPGFFESDTVAHCWPSLTGEFARTRNLTDAHIGWCSPEPCATTPTPASSASRKRR
ncbi:hypothetical protein MSIMFB_01789 [Mycobacterium simulans]|uniref:Uncharacterized protein n=1 Tax=Mycobacterium simulans TaxID=627089 RepID=A0A7Z7N910_9MYCO|nr:hypothetical protein [Mycobacterium simulans]SOJ54290.1 hypothetical protein MSIMFB_01789 [Mycobacterium simulans]